MAKPLVVFSGGEYEDDEIIIYTNKEGLLGLRKLIDETINGKTVTPFTVYCGKKEHHGIVIEKTTHADMMSEFDEES